MATKKRPQASDDASSLQSDPHGATDVFDVRRVRELVELMREFDLSLVELKQGPQRVRLRRGPEPLAAPVAPMAMAGAGSAAGGATGSAAGRAAGSASASASPSAATARAAEAAPQPSGKKSVLIKSPMVGTFYAAPKPDAPPYVKVGDMIGPDTVVCIIEAMKVFNELPAEVAGRIVAVLVESGTPVEYGQALFEVEPK